MRDENEITKLLHEWNLRGDAVEEELFAAVYSELRRQARILMSRERDGHTLQPTALVHEAMLKLGDGSRVEWNDRSHFFGIVSRMMRQILVDHARHRGAFKRGNGAVHLSVDTLEIPVEDRASSILGIDEALSRLERIDKQAATVVEYRFFGGLTNQEIAEAMDLSERSVAREWASARLWLLRELSIG